MTLRLVALAAWLALVPSSLTAQSLLLDAGQNGVEAVAGWSFGPSSDGLETRVGISLGGRIDFGAGFNRYTTDFDDGSSSTFTEIAPFVRWLAVREDANTPVTLALSAQYFADDFEGDDSDGYAMAGPAVYKRLQLGDRLTLYPSLGFALVHESYTFGGETDRATYLARTLGLTFAIALSGDGQSLLRAEVDETSFRREGYRGVRVGFVRRF